MSVFSSSSSSPSHSPLPSGPARSAVVSRLRAAGCVFAEDEAQLLLTTAQTPDELSAMVERRAAGAPLEYVVGWAEFCGLRIAVQPGVFVPRRRTERLVRRAVALAPAEAVVVDLCCGSGAVGAAVAALAGGRVELYAADIDSVAVRCARRNLAACGGRVYQGDLFEALPDELQGRVDLLLANVPYVPTGEIELLPAEAREYEERVALDGGDDGLDVLRRVAAAAPRWLVPGGHLLVEASERQAPRAAGVCAHNGLVPQVTGGEQLPAEVVVGRRPALRRRRGRGGRACRG